LKESLPGRISMGNTWYFVEKNDKAGPIDDTTLEKYIRDKKLGEKSYVWKKGFEDWKRIEDVAELDKYFNETPISPMDNFDEVPFFEEENQTAGLKESLDVSDYLELEDTNKIKKVNTSATVEDKSMGINWNQISHDAQIFTIKVGMDRGAEENEYGPFSLNMLKKLFDENRVNAKTFIFTPGMTDWIFLADLPIFSKIFQMVPPVIEEIDRRVGSRRPFVAKMFFHNNAKLFEGICRDISVGGLQVLVSKSPVKVGEIISLNVHPENSEYSFVASAKVVRLLNGGQGFSLIFKNLSDEATRAINNYLERI